MSIVRYRQDTPASVSALRTVADRVRAREMSACQFGSGGTCCRNCNMGSCQIIDGVEDLLGVCGASSDTVAARNLARIVASGLALQIEEAKELVRCFVATARGETPFSFFDEKALSSLSARFGLETDGLSPGTLALQLSEEILADFGSQDDAPARMFDLPEKRRQLLQGLAVLPRGYDREVVELLHRTHMGVDQEYINLMRQTSRCALADGWGVSRLIGDLSEIMFPSPQPSASHPGTLAEDTVNVLVFGQTPQALEALLEAESDGEVRQQLTEARATGLVVARGSIGRQESDLLGGRVDAMVLGGSCIIPSLTRIAKEKHTRLVTIGPTVRVSGLAHLPLGGPKTVEHARQILKSAIAAFKQRKTGGPALPEASARLETDPGEAAAPDCRLLARELAAGRIRGIALLMGCEVGTGMGDSALLIAEQLLAADVLVLAIGCIAELLAGASGLGEKCGAHLQAACRDTGLAPVSNLGSCVHSNRLLRLAGGLVAEGAGTDCAELPLVAAIPGWTSERIVCAGQALVASGITVFVNDLPVSGSKKLADYLQHGCLDDYLACWRIEREADKLAMGMLDLIAERRDGWRKQPADGA